MVMVAHAVGVSGLTVARARRCRGPRMAYFSEAMHNHNTGSIMEKRHYAWVLLLALGHQQVAAQEFGELNINNVQARFYANGLISLDRSTYAPHFEVPYGAGVNALYSAGLWVGGLTPDNQLRLAAMRYNEGSDYFPGPLDNNGSCTPDVSDLYNAVWTVTRAEVAAHEAYFACVNDPNCDLAAHYPNGYTIPPSFFDWPAINSNAVYDPHLAPFIDFNGDGNYMPSEGDAPCILGDQALYFVCNDACDLHTETGGQRIGLEVRAMPFAYTSGLQALDQTVFVHYHLINRGTQTLSNTRIAFYNDVDLGNPNDDFMGTDPSRNLQYFYNADNNDEDAMGIPGYGTLPPAFGVVMLKGPLLDGNGVDDPVTNTMPAWNGQGFGDGIVDNERYGLANSMYFNRDGAACCNDPATAGQYYSYLSGNWKDGTPLTYGGSGYSTDTSAIPARFIYPGYWDPNGVGTDGIPQAPWAEDVLTVPDRRGLSSMGPITLEPGEHVDLLLAYVIAWAASPGTGPSIAALQTRVDSVRDFANTLPIWNIPEEQFQGACEGEVSLGVEAAKTGQPLSIYPMPATDHIQLIAPSDLSGAVLTMRDAMGRVVATRRLASGTNTIDIRGLAGGVYSCEARSAKARYAGRIMKE
jgi:hypothetical protein